MFYTVTLALCAVNMCALSNMALFCSSLISFLFRHVAQAFSIIIMIIIIIISSPLRSVALLTYSHVLCTVKLITDYDIAGLLVSINIRNPKHQSSCVTGIPFPTNKNPFFFCNKQNYTAKLPIRLVT